MLDLCAAPGGKTAQLCARGYAVTALDSDADRLVRLEDNLSRLGLSAEIVVADASDATCACPVRRHPRRRALLGDRHLPPPSRGADQPHRRRHRRARGAATAHHCQCRTGAQARRYAGLSSPARSNARKARSRHDWIACDLSPALHPAPPTADSDPDLGLCAHLGGSFAHPFRSFGRRKSGRAAWTDSSCHALFTVNDACMEGFPIHQRSGAERDSGLRGFSFWGALSANLGMGLGMSACPAQAGGLTGVGSFA